MLLLRTMWQYFSRFFFNDTATTEIYTLSLHDALPISPSARHGEQIMNSAYALPMLTVFPALGALALLILRSDDHKFIRDRKSTRLNSSHGYISYAVFCLKKKTRRRLTR